MKSKLLFSVVSAVLAILFIFSGTAASAEGADSVSEVISLADGIIAFNLSESGESDIQSWIDGALSENAGVSSEWYILTLSRTGGYNFSAYENALLGYLSENTVRSAVSRQKYALALLASGSDSEYITDTANDSIGEMGIMSLVYGLHILNNGVKSEKYTAEAVVSELLSLQLADGGWALSGTVSDNDITAMTVQSLTPYYNDNPDIKAAVDTAVSLLSERQLENGEYSSYGVANAETTAQVLVALSGLGIDAYEDERFIKNGKTLVDGLEIFRLDDGSYCHETGGASNENATVQAYYSLISYRLMREGNGLFYVLDKNDPSDEDTDNPVVTEPPVTDSSAEDNIGDAPESENKISYKVWACIAIVAVGAVICVILTVFGKKNRKNFIGVAVIAAFFIVFVLTTNFVSTDEYYGGAAKKENPVGTVTVSIRCDTIIGKSDKAYIPENGIITEDTFEIEQGETVFDILIEASKKHSIQLEHSGTGDMTYISGINYIYEFDFGDLSGWLYYVNGESPSVGCNKYELKDGDKIEWHYSLEMGNDLD